MIFIQDMPIETFVFSLSPCLVITSYSDLMILVYIKLLNLLQCICGICKIHFTYDMYMSAFGLS